MTHLPFRPWCADCVAGRAASDPHRRRTQAVASGPPRVSVDYGFVSERGPDDQEADARRTILVVKVEGCGAVMARCVRGKGRADPQAVGWLLDQQRRLGIGRCILQADGEPAQRSYAKDVIEEAARSGSLGIASAHAPARPPGERWRREGRPRPQGPGQGDEVRLGPARRPHPDRQRRVRVADDLGGRALDGSSRGPRRHDAVQTSARATLGSPPGGVWRAGDGATAEGPLARRRRAQVGPGDTVGHGRAPRGDGKRRCETRAVRPQAAGAREMGLRARAGDHGDSGRAREMCRRDAASAGPSARGHSPSPSGCRAPAPHARLPHRGAGHARARLHAALPAMRQRASRHS